MLTTLLYLNVQPPLPPLPFINPQISQNLSILRLHEISKGFRLALVAVNSITVVCIVAVSVAVVLWADVFHLVHTAALGTALDGAIARCL
jgi:hypothetical protein